MTNVIACLAALGAAVFQCIPAVAQHAIEVEQTDEGFLFREGDADVLFYQRTPKSLDGRYERANYVHPLYDLDGNVLTEDFPADHLHHRGVFWAWHQVWVGGRMVGDPWTASDFIWDVDSAELLGAPDGARDLHVRVLWKSPHLTDDNGVPAPLVEELTTIRVHPARSGTRAVDFQIDLRAVREDVQIGGSDDEKGYGGFSTRIRLPEDIVFTGRDGAATPQVTSIDAGPWMDMSARFSDADAVSGLTILVHPASAGFPQPWVLRQNRSMQNPAWPGREPVALSRKDPVTLRYRLVLHRGPGDVAAIEDWYRDYTAGDTSSARREDP